MTRGPEKEIFFPQAHVAGEALQTDFTHATELGITIQGRARARAPGPLRAALPSSSCSAS